MIRPSSKTAAILLTVLLVLQRQQAAASQSGYVPDLAPHLQQQQQQGIPVCPAGLPACGTHGCYTPAVTRCDPQNGCISAKLVSQLTSLVRFGTISTSAAAAAGACPIGFANACGKQQFCGIGESCSRGSCVSSGPQPPAAAINVGPTAAFVRSACLVARYGSSGCSGDVSSMAPVDCNGIGVPTTPGIYCFQSQLFNCAGRPGGALTFTCRGLAGVAHTVGAVWNTTMHSAAAMAAEVADAMEKQEQLIKQQKAAASAGGPGVATRAATGPMQAGLASAPDSGSSSSASDNAQVWKAGANAALGSLGNVVRDKGQPLLQPIFQGLADLVSNASKSLLNITVTDAGSGAGSRAGIAAVGGNSRQQDVSSLGPLPFKAAAEAPQHPLMMLLATLLSATLLLML